MKIKTLGIIAISTPLFFTSCSDVSAPDENKNLEEVTYTTTNNSTCDCEPSWFNGNVILAPEEGNDSPFGPLGYASTTNCLFHQWSWQKFLYLTQVPTGQNLPYFLSEMEQVSSEMDAVPQPNNVIVLSETAQAGGGGILQSNGSFGSGTAETIYYSIHINTEFKNAATTFEETIEAYPDSVANRWSFPVGAVELKASWVNSTAINPDSINNYYTTSAVINSGNPVTVALLGLHVVGIVENHPEFVWATFEHNDLTPYYDWDSTTTSSDFPVTTSQNLPLFAQNATANLSNIIWEKEIKNPNNVFSIYKYGTPQIPGGGFMNGTSQTNGEENYNNIQHINQSVHDTLTTRGIESELIWTNYFYDGSIWMNTDSMSHEQQIDSILARVNNFGDANTNGPLRGSLGAANISMETYEQTKSSGSIHDMNVDSLMNCFICHGPSSYLPIADSSNAQSPTYISHIFMNYMHEHDSLATKEEMRQIRFQLFEKFRNK